MTTVVAIVGIDFSPIGGRKVTVDVHTIAVLTRGSFQAVRIQLGNDEQMFVHHLGHSGLQEIYNATGGEGALRLITVDAAQDENSGRIVDQFIDLNRPILRF